MRSAFALLSLAASALAFTVTEPSGSQNWVLAADNNTVSWTAVSTDRKNFTIVLVNQKQTPAYSQIISALVDTSLDSVAVSLPNTVTAGKNYQVNLVQDSENLNTILAQSDDFEVLAALSSTSSSASHTVATAATPTAAAAAASTTAPTASASATASNSGASSNVVASYIVVIAVVAGAATLF